MRQHLLAGGFFGCLFAGGLAFAAAPLNNIPLQWRPTSALGAMGTIDLSGATVTTKIHFEPLTDARQNPALVAENREKAEVRPMTTSSDVAAFVTDHLKDSVREAGLNVVDAEADVDVSGEIRKFFVAETDTYNGEISLFIHIKDKNGKELWTGIVGGDATRFGRSYKAENYFEVMSDMVLRATYNLLSSGDFRAALAKH